MHEFPYSSAPKFKKFQISHCISFRSDFCSLPLSTTLTFLLYPFCIEKKRPQNHLPSTKLTTVYEWFAVPCFELCKIKVFQADMAA